MLQILEKLRQWWRPKEAPAAGPRRVKQYASASGFQYQYQLLHSIPGDYEFAIWTSAHPAKRMRILVPILELAARERYALAKLNLFRSFEELAPAALPVLLTVTDTELLDALEKNAAANEGVS